MAKRIPKYMLKKIGRMNKLMQEIVDLNVELEEWMERNGIYDAFDFTSGYRDVRGYEILCVDSFVNEVNVAINQGGNGNDTYGEA